MVINLHTENLTKFCNFNHTGNLDTENLAKFCKFNHTGNLDTENLAQSSVSYCNYNTVIIGVLKISYSLVT